MYRYVCLIIMCFLWAVCQATEPTKNIFGNNVTNWNDVTGEATGDFQFLGSLYFPENKKDKARMIQVSIFTKQPAPENLELLFFNNQGSSFDRIGRGAFGDSCNGKSMNSKSFQECKLGTSCSHGLRVSDFQHSRFGPDSDFCANCHQYKRRIAIHSASFFAWYFVAGQCSGGTVQIAKYRIFSLQAGPFPSQDAKQPDAGTAVSGYANGNFELLGSLCFFTGPSFFGDPSVAMTVTYVDETPNRAEAVNLLVYDDEGLNQIFDSKSSSYGFSETECQRRRNLALKTYSLHKGSNSHHLTVAFDSIGARGTEHAAVRLTFVIDQCTASSQLNVKSYKIHAPGAVNCGSQCPLLENCGTGPVVVHGRHLRAVETH